MGVSITENLFHQLNGKAVKAADVPGFKVLVASPVFHPPASVTEFGTYGPYESAAEITHGKPGGTNVGESFTDVGKGSSKTGKEK